MNDTVWEEAGELAGWQTESEELTRSTALQQVTDQRRTQGKRYPVVLVLTDVLLAQAAGETTFQAIAEWMWLWGRWVQEALAGV